MHENKKGVRALGTALRQNLDVSQELPAEMLVLLLRLARADMARLPLPDATPTTTPTGSSTARPPPGIYDRLAGRPRTPTAAALGGRRAQLVADLAILVGIGEQARGRA